MVKNVSEKVVENGIFVEKSTGVVKWFSQEKGYGYITNKDNYDLYFGVKDVIGAELPEYGDKVEYETYNGRENITAAKEIIIIERKNPNFKKIHCDSCKLDVKPKHWHFGGTDYTNMKTAYLCPYCGNRLYETGGGFNKLAKFILIITSVAIGILTFLAT